MRGAGPGSRWQCLPRLSPLAEFAVLALGALAQATPPPVAGVRLRIMQPNLPQDAKFRPENKTWILNHYLDLSIRELRPQITLALTALPR